MDVPESPIVLRLENGRRVRAAREARGLNLVEAAARLDITKSSLNRVENGQTLLSVHLAKSMMDLYDWCPDDLLDRVRRARRTGWWKEHGVPDLWFIAFEAGASRLSAFHTDLVPGLLQTAGYARALFSASRRDRSEDRRRAIFPTRSWIRICVCR